MNFLMKQYNVFYVLISYFKALIWPLLTMIFCSAVIFSLYQIDKKLDALNTALNGFSITLEDSKLSSGDMSESIATYFDKKELAAKRVEIERFEEIAKENLLRWKDSNYSNYSKDKDYIYGDPKARYTLIEFTDTECPYCQSFHGTPSQIVEKSNGAVNWKIKNFPLSFHGEIAVDEAMMAECIGSIAGPASYFAAFDQIFTLTKSNGGGVPDLSEIPKLVGVDSTAAMKCVKDDTFLSKVKKDIAEGRSFGVNGTPATLVYDNVTGNNILVPTAVSPGQLVSTIKKLAKAELNNNGDTKAVK